MKLRFKKHKMVKALRNRFLLPCCLAVVMMVMPLLNHAQTTDKNDFRNNHISLMISDIIIARVSVDYERIIDDEGYLALHMPVSWVVRDYLDVFRDEELKYRVGLGLNIYPTAQGKFKYFLGPELRYSSIDAYRYVHKSDNTEDRTSMPYGTTQQKVKGMSKMAFLVNNGMIFTPTSHFAVSTVLGLGLQSDFGAKDSNNRSEILPMATFSIRLGYKF